MTNYEHYKEQIKKLGYLHFAVRKDTGEAVDCSYLRCRDCIFGSDDDIICDELIAMWLDEEYKIPLSEEGRIMTFAEILEMLHTSCTRGNGHEDTIIQCATQIYIAQMKNEKEEREKQ